MKNKVVMITGASQGLGKELAIQIANLGAKVILIARTEKLLSEVQNQIVQNGGQGEYFVCDVTDQKQVENVVDQVVQKYGQIDVLINNAGLWTTDEIESNNSQHILDVFKINSIAPIYTCKEIIPIFEKQKSGHFVFINSIAGLEMPENKNWATYSASKWALTGYTKSLISKFSKTGIKVTSIHPGPIDTKIDKNSGDDWGKERSFAMSVVEVANAVVGAINAPGNIQVGLLELRKTNWE